MENFLRNNIIIHKFGGSSLANADRFFSIKKLLNEEKEVIVVSAIKDATSTLQLILNNAANGKNFLEILKNLEYAHFNIIKSLHFNICTLELEKIIKNDFEAIQNILLSVMHLTSYSKEIEDFVLGFGEQWSAQILSHYLAQFYKTRYLDASKVLSTHFQNNIISINWEKSSKNLYNFLNENEFDKLVVTGFIAANEEEKRTTLGRNGSDFSAAIFAKLFKAKELYIWKDVDGILSANPTKVRDAFPIESLSYKEALELAYFGAKVIHPRTISPAQEEGIPIFIKNSFKPLLKGTKISDNPQKTENQIKGVTGIDDVALINIEGAGMIGVSGISARIFDAIQQKNISVILISQASSEYSICFAVSKEYSELTLKTLSETLQLEIEKGHIENISVENECSILAIIGDEMIGSVGVAGKLCSTLSKANINIIAIAQGSSERNISVVINKKDLNKALNSVHSSFYLSHKTIAIGLIGLGSVGSAFFEQLKSAASELKNKYQIDFSVRGIMNSKKMCLSEKSMDITHCHENLKNSMLEIDIERFSSHIANDDSTHGVIIDCTADFNIAQKYINFITKGLHIITPNKHANGGDIAYYKELKSLIKQKKCHYYYEATVCAGLPVINTLQDIIKTGDEIYNIEGIVSGTLSYIFNELAKGKRFSEVVYDAKSQGFTEPDPRADLSGQDVARKLICLAREVGFDISLENINVHNLIPKELQNCSVNEFLERLPEFDEQMSIFVEKANAQNEKICYVGSISQSGEVKINLGHYSQKHPFSRLEGTDNMLIFYTRRYHKQPLVIQGPGAGAEVTASGIFADLLRLASSLA
ncbi:bifunctional aspartate kinase/homoserine dehydrogenase I [Fluviispira multicolorata]|uniref:Bifunctional aspartate kinase/homoserine dehydrogenase I n=1 Tax=Fluviispira multicolorata TaxID=2654512 RepID=A0A833JFE5_9BACT|nr:bifunctional aspartate kinase/homoserine dehydrogenase I [Fluviispira multicolorata]KAB8033694.1 bifunctional aspartate kinase/homoserine dehydrogenase I [Fluviispira multicolorata]